MMTISGLFSPSSNGMVPKKAVPSIEVVPLARVPCPGGISLLPHDPICVGGQENGEVFSILHRS
jgi:hypothetical protein